MTFFWKVVSLLALGTFVIRFSVIGFLSRGERVGISDRVREGFSFIPAAILPALIAPGVFFHQGHVASLLGKERLVALLASTGVAFYYRKTLPTIGFGLLFLYALTRWGS